MRHLHYHLWQLFPHSVICAGSDIFQNQLDLKSFSASGGIPWLWFSDDMSGSLTQWRYILSQVTLPSERRHITLNVHSDQPDGIIKRGQWLAHILCCALDELCLCIFFFPMTHVQSYYLLERYLFFPLLVVVWYIYFIQIVLIFSHDGEMLCFLFCCCFSPYTQSIRVLTFNIQKVLLRN